MPAFSMGKTAADRHPPRNRASLCENQCHMEPILTRSTRLLSAICASSSPPTTSSATIRPSSPASDSLIEAGLIDSTGVLELVGYLEEQFGVRITNEELLPENLDSIDNIVGFVERKRESGQAA